MSVRIRLARVGRKKIPHYRIVVMDSRDRRDGAYIEQIGVYHPSAQPAQVEIREDSALKWLTKGAVPTETVRGLLRERGILYRFSLLKRKVAPEKLEESMVKWRERTAVRAAKAPARWTNRKKVQPSTEGPVES